MKENYWRSFVSILLVSGLVRCGAQSNVYELHVVGYLHTTFQPGLNLFVNPFLSSSDMLTALIPSAPDGTSVSLWDPIANHVAQTATYSSGAWSSDFVLSAGRGALLSTSTQFVESFMGEVLNPDGSFILGNYPLTLPLPFAGPNGRYLLGCKTPIGLSGNNVFVDVLGRSPAEGEKFERLNAQTQTFSVTTYASGSWDNGDPILLAGESAFFTIVPEPSSAMLLGFGICFVCFQRRFAAGLNWLVKTDTRLVKRIFSPDCHGCSKRSIVRVRGIN